MSDRWKYQIKIGFLLCLFIDLFGTLFELRIKPFSEQLDSVDFYIRLVFSFFFGIFVAGYFSWKRKNGEDGNKWPYVFKRIKVVFKRNKKEIS